MTEEAKAPEEIMAARQPIRVKPANRTSEQMRSAGEPRENRAIEKSPMEVKIKTSGLNFFYGASQALHGIDLQIPARRVTAFIGPSGCGKSTFLRTLNRMNDIIVGARIEGLIEIDGENIYAPGTDVVALRQKVGMVFQKSN